MQTIIHQNKLSHFNRNQKGRRKVSVLLALGIMLSGVVASGQALAESGSVYHSGQASKHSALAVAHGLGSSAKVASAVIAIPIIAFGTVSLAAGGASIAMGNAIADSGTGAANKRYWGAQAGPIQVTELIITSDPAPDVVLQQRNEKVNNDTVKSVVTNTTVRSTTRSNTRSSTETLVIESEVQ